MRLRDVVPSNNKSTPGSGKAPNDSSNPPVSTWLPDGFRLSNWRVWPDQGKLSAGDDSLHLEPKVMEVLVYLARHAGRVVSRDELLDAIWPDCFIQDGVLSRHVSELRRVLGDDARSPRFIETIPKRGYRLIAEVSWGEEEHAGEAAGSRPPVESTRTVPSPLRPKLLVGAVLLTGGLLALAWLVPMSPRAGGVADRRSSPPVDPREEAGEPSSVAVLPLEGLGLPAELDHLRNAVAEELTTALSHAHELQVRPLSLTRRFATTGLDSRELGRRVHARWVITGQVRLEDGLLRIDFEAIDVELNSVVWRRYVKVGTDEPTSLQTQIVDTVRYSLLPALGVPSPEKMGAVARDAKAYELFLRSLGTARDPVPNREAIEDLQEAVRRDPTFAPAWASLAERLYFERAYGSNAEAVGDQALAAISRALELDPDLVFPAVLRMAILTESGRLAAAFDAAWDTVLRHPRRAESHFALAYVYRYAGLLEEAARQCDLALTLSPANYRLRSCAVVFQRLDRPQRAQTFIELEPDSVWALTYRGYGLLEAGQPEAARELWHELPQTSTLSGLLDNCLDRPDSPETHRSLQPHQRQPTGDPEAWYIEALLLHGCGRREAALATLITAARSNYCVVWAFEPGSVFADLRGLEGWEKARDEAIACRDAFVAHRATQLEQPPS